MKKKDGSLRPCINYRGLNNIMVKNTYPLPLMSSAFERLQGAGLFHEIRPSQRISFGSHKGGG